MAVAVGLVTLGALIAAGSFLYAAVNIVRGSQNVVSPNRGAGLSASLGEMFKRHIASMVGMVAGGILVIIGVALMVGQFLSKIIGS